jgi:hypothetical protein
VDQLVLAGTGRDLEVGQVSETSAAAVPTADNERLDELAAALQAVGLGCRIDGDALVVDGNRVVPFVVLRAHPTSADLSQLVHEHRRRSPAVVVADRNSEPGRAVLRDAGWGWLDRRGHVRLWASGVRIDAAVPGVVSERSGPSSPWTQVGLEVALAALVEPTEPVTARRVAPRIDRSVGAVHELLGRFGQDGLIGRSSRLPLMPDLFWETAAHWPDDGWTPLAVPVAELGNRVGADVVVRVDERAATLGGARIAAVADLPARCYLTSPAAFRRSRQFVDRDAPTRTWVRIPPVRWLPLNEDHPPDEAHPWQVAHPIVCALRLAADPARGREIVEAWGIVP